MGYSVSHDRPPARTLSRDIADVRARVETVLQEAVADRARVLVAVSPQLEPVAAFLGEQVRRGKRVRAMFCYWGWQAAGGHAGGPPADEAVVLRAAAALELFHLGALAHDDVMDRSLTRRGLPSLRAQFADLHRAGSLDGDPAAFGDGAAILAGDLCLAWSDELVPGGTGASPSERRARSVFETMRTEVMAGQFLDLVSQARRRATAQEARDVVRYKSAKYTVEQPLLLGGELGGASPEVGEVFSAFGLAVGEAFQLRDDVLGVWGDPGTTGKPVGDDLREGKQTLLVALARQRAGAGQRALLDRSVGDADLDADGVARLRAVLVDTGALAEVEALIRDFHDAALDALERLAGLCPSEDQVQAAYALRELAGRCAWRSA